MSRSGTNGFEMISIHALREEGDRAGSGVSLEDVLFLSTPSARRATFPSVRHSA